MLSFVLILLTVIAVIALIDFIHSVIHQVVTKDGGGVSLSVVIVAISLIMGAIVGSDFWSAIVVALLVLSTIGQFMTKLGAWWRLWRGWFKNIHLPK